MRMRPADLPGFRLRHEKDESADIYQRDQDRRPYGLSETAAGEHERDKENDRIGPAPDRQLKADYRQPAAFGQAGGSPYQDKTSGEPNATRRS